MVAITEEHLKQIMPTCQNAADWVEPLNSAMDKFEINSVSRIAAFLAQIAHESGELRLLEENLHYSASRLVQVWPRRFPTLSAALPYDRNPQKIANKVYADRMGNGDENSGDGWAFHGRGLIQLTGRSNYKTTAQALNIDLETHPELLTQPVYAALSAAFFWKSHGLNELADSNSPAEEDEDFITITKRINGGIIGLDERKKYWEKAKAVLASLANGSTSATTTTEEAATPASAPASDTPAATPAAQTDSTPATAPATANTGDDNSSDDSDNYGGSFGG